MLSVYRKGSSEFVGICDTGGCGGFDIKSCYKSHKIIRAECIKQAPEVVSSELVSSEASTPGLGPEGHLEQIGTSVMETMVPHW